MGGKEQAGGCESEAGRAGCRDSSTDWGLGAGLDVLACLGGDAGVVYEGSCRAGGQQGLLVQARGFMLSRADTCAAKPRRGVMSKERSLQL
jgi:hypothetical protein